MSVRSWSFQLTYKISLILSKKKLNGFEGNCCILRIDIAWGLHKLGIILENKVILKFKLSKHVFYKKCGPKLILKTKSEKKFEYFLTQNTAISLKTIHFSDKIKLIL